MTLPPQFSNWRYPHRIVYKGYRLWCMRNDGKQVAAHYIYKHFNYHLPRKFQWSDFSDKHGLVRYIDALLDKDALVYREIESEGLANGQVYDDPPRDVPVQQISPQLLLACLLGEYPIECPSDVTLHVRPIKGKYYQLDRLKAEMVQTGVLDAYYEALEQRRRHGLPLRTPKGLGVTEGKDGKPLAVEHPYNQPGFNLAAAADQGMAQPVQQQPASMPERTISSRLIHDCCEIITYNEQIYIRRIVSGQGQVLLVSTAPTVEGPWVESYKDEVGLRLHKVSA